MYVSMNKRNWKDNLEILATMFPIKHPKTSFAFDYFKLQASHVSRKKNNLPRSKHFLIHKFMTKLINSIISVLTPHS